MTSKRCKRVWEAEALEDGRISGELRAAFERHAESCAECRAELRALAALRAQGSRMTPPPQTEIDERRLRSRLIAEANRKLVEPSPIPRRALALLFAVVVLIIGVVALRRPAPPSYKVLDVDSASWSVADAGLATRLVLHGGTARFEVVHLRPDQRFRVLLPDGEIEVRGTAFAVKVDHAHTESVVVETGLVALTVDGSTRLLAAGQRWDRAHLVVAEKPPMVEQVANPATATAPSTTSAPTASTKPPTVGPTKSAAVPSSAAAPAASTFVDAMGAYHAGDYANAEALFATFMTEAPADGRVEDAMFLRAVCAAKRGDHAEAAGRAKAYLVRWPAGFHAGEAKKLSSD